jgi:hypothetical protein
MKMMCVAENADGGIAGQPVDEDANERVDPVRLPSITRGGGIVALDPPLVVIRRRCLMHRIHRMTWPTKFHPAPAWLVTTTMKMDQPWYRLLWC